MMLTLFLGTLLITVLCCAVMWLAVSTSGKPLPGGCGKTVPDELACRGCPNRHKHRCARQGGMP